MRIHLDDVLGVAALFLLLAGGFWIGAGMGLPTGAEDLLQEVR